MRITESRLRRIVRSVIREGLHIDSHMKYLLDHSKDWKDVRGFDAMGANIKVYKLGQELYKKLQNSSIMDQDPECVEHVKDMNWLAPSIRDEVIKRIGSGQHGDSIRCIYAHTGDNTGDIQGSDEHIDCAVEVCTELYSDSKSGGTMWQEMCNNLRK